jgi:hypothetical protein
VLDRVPASVEPGLDRLAPDVLDRLGRQPAAGGLGGHLVRDQHLVDEAADPVGQLPLVVGELYQRRHRTAPPGTGTD